MRRIKLVLLEEKEIETISAIAKRRNIGFSGGVSVLVKDFVKEVLIKAGHRAVVDREGFPVGGIAGIASVGAIGLGHSAHEYIDIAEINARFGVTKGEENEMD